jgi:myosin heavy subunit
VISRCWVQDENEGWVGAEVVSKDVINTKVTLQLRLENGTVGSKRDFGFFTC